MLLSSEDIICIELGILLSSWPSTCLNLNKLFLFGIIMMGKAASAGKCAFEMISLRLKVAHHNKKISPSPILQIGGVYYRDVEGSLINKKDWKIALACFCGRCADLMPFSTNLIRKTFLSRTERFGSFLFLPSAKSLENGRLSFCFSRQKVEPVT